jgi:glycosyltransferase involved in cell wall biosynthesis
MSIHGGTRDGARQLGRPPVAIVHDYLTQHGGAERVVLTMAEAFPEAAVHTSFYDPDGTFPAFFEHRVRTQPINRIGPLRSHPRAALPLLAASFSRELIDADVVLCSSSGWAHGVLTTGRKVVFCYTPARWLYQGDRYLGDRPRPVARTALALLAPPLRRWDRRSAASADRYLVTSTEVRRRVQQRYRRDAEVIPPPPAIGAEHPRRPLERIEPGYWLCVSRFLAYKHVDAVVEAFAALPGERLVLVGTGPQEAALRASAGPNVTVAGRVDDDELAWLYANCQAVVLASHEDYGLVPLEAAGFGRPAVVLEWGGFLDTVVPGSTGLFFPDPTPTAIRDAVARAGGVPWSEKEIVAHASRFSRERFVQRLRAVVAEESDLV